MLLPIDQPSSGGIGGGAEAVPLADELSFPGDDESLRHRFFGRESRIERGDDLGRIEASQVSARADDRPWARASSSPRGDSARLSSARNRPVPSSGRMTQPWLPSRRAIRVRPSRVCTRTSLPARSTTGSRILIALRDGDERVAIAQCLAREGRVHARDENRRAQSLRVGGREMAGERDRAAEPMIPAVRLYARVRAAPAAWRPTSSVCAKTALAVARDIRRTIARFLMVIALPYKGKERIY